MTRIQRLTKDEMAVRGGSANRRAPRRGARAAASAGKGARDGASGRKSNKGAFVLQAMKIADFYRPLKKPVTLRLDADVLAWFKKDGRRYQTRINQALRKVMEREMKSSA
jgi:uncharacterized protein (DUF4415 family)